MGTGKEHRSAKARRARNVGASRIGDARRGLRRWEAVTLDVSADADNGGRFFWLPGLSAARALICTACYRVL